MPPNTNSNTAEINPVPSSSSSELHPSDDLTVDGSYANGGGQIVRITLALTALLSRSVRIINIRSGAGLRPQHLEGVSLVSKMASASLQGAHLNSKSLHFQTPNSQSPQQHAPLPLPVTALVNTAGATSLLLQAALPVALKFLPSAHHQPHTPSLLLQGGTSTAFSPTSDYVKYVLAPNLRHFGIALNYHVARHGFFPKGGGKCHVYIDKSNCSSTKQNHLQNQYTLNACDMSRRGHIKSIRGSLIVSGKQYLEAGVADCITQNAVRVVSQFTRTNTGYPSLTLDDIEIQHLSETDVSDKTIVLTLFATSSTDTVLGSSVIWSERDALRIMTNAGLTPPRRKCSQSEKIAFWRQSASLAGEAAAERLVDALQTNAAVDENMADQLCIFAAMASGTSVILIPQLTKHLESVRYVMQLFGAHFTIEELPNSTCCLLSCEGKGIPLQC